MLTAHIHSFGDRAVNLVTMGLNDSPYGFLALLTDLEHDIWRTIYCITYGLLLNLHRIYLQRFLL